MKCPNCGKDIPDGMLYCEACGMEIQMVPEFDPDFDNQIHTPLSDVATLFEDDGATEEEDLTGPFTDGFEGEASALTQDLHVEEQQGFRYKLDVLLHKTAKMIARHPIRFEGACILIMAVIGITIFLLSGGSSEARLQKLIRDAQQASDAGSYEEAAQLLEAAYGENEKSSEVLFLLADAYMASEDQEAAIGALRRILDSAAFSDEEKRDAYMVAAQIYADAGQSEALAALLDTCPFEEVTAQYVATLPGVPVISVESGDFDEAFEVEITADAGLEIYYTTDGRSPGTSSTLYEEPIVFEETGDFILQAIAVDEEGRSSEIAVEEYHIVLLIPAAPQVMEDSGSYKKDTKIVVIAGYDCTIYYTSDGTRPDETSKQYTQPIQMPYGKTTYRFICYNTRGIASEETVREYSLYYEKKITQSQAITSVMQTLLAQGVLLDLNGDALGVDGIYEYAVEEVIYIEGYGEFYRISETHRYADGRTEATGYMYAVNTQTGTPYRLFEGVGGAYSVVQMQI